MRLNVPKFSAWTAHGLAGQLCAAALGTLLKSDYKVTSNKTSVAFPLSLCELGKPRGYELTDFDSLAGPVAHPRPERATPKGVGAAYDASLDNR